MRSVPPSITSVAVRPARRTATLPASMRDLDYATWHAHIAGITGSTASTRQMPEKRPAPVRELVAAAAQSARPAA